MGVGVHQGFCHTAFQCCETIDLFMGMFVDINRLWPMFIWLACYHLTFCLSNVVGTHGMRVWKIFILIFHKKMCILVLIKVWDLIWFFFVKTVSNNVFRIEVYILYDRTLFNHNVLDRGILITALTIMVMINVFLIFRSWKMWLMHYYSHSFLFYVTRVKMSILVEDQKKKLSILPYVGVW